MSHDQRQLPANHQLRNVDSPRLVCSNLSNGTCAAPTNGQPAYNYVYDRFGNRWQQNGPQSMIKTFTGNNPGNPANNNRVDGLSYDAAGNLLNDGTHSYTYDAENRITQVDGGSTATYLYDAEGHAIQKTINASNNQYETAGTWDFLYDLSGRFYAELAAGQSFWRGEVYSGNRHLLRLGICRRRGRGNCWQQPVLMRRWRLRTGRPQFVRKLPNRSIFDHGLRHLGYAEYRCYRHNRRCVQKGANSCGCV
jgi:YD repeat-containing protein